MKPLYGSQFTHLPARPTTYRGTRMRSRLEANWARMFDVAGPKLGIRKWEYEPACFPDPFGTYLPDFRLNGHIYVEIKPPMVEGDIRYTKRRMEIIWSSEPDAVLWLIHLQHPEVGGFCIDRCYRGGEWTREHVAGFTEAA